MNAKLKKQGFVCSSTHTTHVLTLLHNYNSNDNPHHVGISELKICAFLNDPKKQNLPLFL